jgi:predicted RNA-binding protein
MYPRSLPVALALALTANCALVAQTQPQETTSLTHVTVIDVDTGIELPDQNVVLQGDRILPLPRSMPQTHRKAASSMPTGDS